MSSISRLVSGSRRFSDLSRLGLQVTVPELCMLDAVRSMPRTGFTLSISRRVE